MEEDIVVGKNESPEAVTFYVKIGIRIALAEISIIVPELVTSFIDESQLSQEDKQRILQVAHKSKKLYFFNRLNVPSQWRGQGIGEQLLNKLKQYLNENDAFLVNTANAYGNKSQEELIAYYQKHQMVLVHEDGGLVYHPELIGTNFELHTGKSKSNRRLVKK